jgi:hypothetical protein
MKAILKPVKVWSPHQDKSYEDEQFITKGTMRVYVGNLFIGRVTPVTTEPEELFKFEAYKLLYYMDEHDNIIKFSKSKGKPLQEILDGVELIFKDFLNKIVV